MKKITQQDNLFICLIFVSCLLVNMIQARAIKSNYDTHNGFKELQNSDSFRSNHNLEKSSNNLINHNHHHNNHKKKTIRLNQKTLHELNRQRNLMRIIFSFGR